MTTKSVYVTHCVSVTLDESKFTEEFLQEFRESFYDFYTVDDHRQHLASLYARGIYGEHSFIEGYGPASDFGIKFDLESLDTEVV